MDEKWYYLDMDGYTKPWELEVGCKYLINISPLCTDLTFIVKKVNIGDYIKLNIEDIEVKKYTLSSISLMDATGQLSVIKLNNIDNTNRPAPDLFNFSLPEGVYLDDQR